MQGSAADVTKRAARMVRSVASAMPSRDKLQQELTDAELAQQRGHYLPDEDERVREVFARYLSVRSVLLETVESIQPILDRQAGDESVDVTDDWHLRTFVVGFAAATMLVRAANFMVGLASERPVVWKKLDGAEPRYGIPANSYTMVYKNLGSARRMWRFYEAMIFYEVHKQDIAALVDDPLVGDLVGILAHEEGFFEKRKRSYLQKKWHYRLHSFKRRNISGYKIVMFHLLKLSGSAIAEMKQPFVKASGEGKRVTKETLATLNPLLRASLAIKVGRIIKH